MLKAIALVVIFLFPLCAQQIKPGSGSNGGGSGFTSDPSYNGAWYPQGYTSGGLGFSVADIAGTATTLIFPADTGAATTGYTLSLGAVAACPAHIPTTIPSTCRYLTWAAAGGTSFTAAGGPVLTFNGMWPFSSNNGAFTATAGTVYCHYAPALYSGTISKIMFWRTAGGSVNKGIAVSIGTAGTIMAQGNTGATVPGVNVQSVALSSPQSITAGTVYELCYANEENNAPKNIFFATSDGDLYNQNSETRVFTYTSGTTGTAGTYAIATPLTGKAAASNAPHLLGKP